MPARLFIHPFDVPLAQRVLRIFILGLPHRDFAVFTPVLMADSGSAISISGRMGKVPCPSRRAMTLGAEERYCSAHSVFMMHPTTLGPFQEALSWERLDTARSSALAEETRTENILRKRTIIPEESLSARRLSERFILVRNKLSIGGWFTECGSSRSHRGTRSFKFNFRVRLAEQV